MKTWKTSRVRRLAKAMASIDNEADMLNFLRDICTLEEIDEVSNRWEAVQLLHQGKPYRYIAEKTGMSTTTVTRIAHWLNNGEGGYRKALEKNK